VCEILQGEAAIGARATGPLKKLLEKGEREVIEVKLPGLNPRLYTSNA